MGRYGQSGELRVKSCFTLPSSCLCLASVSLLLSLLLLEYEDSVRLHQLEGAFQGGASPDRRRRNMEATYDPHLV